MTNVAFLTPANGVETSGDPEMNTRATTEPRELGRLTLPGQGPSNRSTATVENASARIALTLSELIPGVSLLSIFEDRPQLNPPLTDKSQEYPGDLTAVSVSEGTALSKDVELSRQWATDHEERLPVTVIRDADSPDIDWYRMVSNRRLFLGCMVYMRVDLDTSPSIFPRLGFTASDSLARPLRDLVLRVLLSAN